MALMQAVRLIELNKKIGLHGNNGSSPVTRSNALQLFYDCACAASFLSRANDFLCS